MDGKRLAFASRMMRKTLSRFFAARYNRDHLVKRGNYRKCDRRITMATQAKSRCVVQTLDERGRRRLHQALADESVARARRVGEHVDRASRGRPSCGA